MAPEVMTTETHVVGTLTAGHLCDRCGSQAYVEVRFLTGTLTFCSHHFQQYEARLRNVAVTVQDERDRLYREEDARREGPGEEL